MKINEITDKNKSAVIFTNEGSFDEILKLIDMNKNIINLGTFIITSGKTRATMMYNTIIINLEKSKNIINFEFPDNNDIDVKSIKTTLSYQVTDITIINSKLAEKYKL